MGQSDTKLFPSLGGACHFPVRPVGQGSLVVGPLKEFQGVVLLRPTGHLVFEVRGFKAGVRGFGARSQFLNARTQTTKPNPNFPKYPKWTPEGTPLGYEVLEGPGRKSGQASHFEIKSSKPDQMGVSHLLRAPTLCLTVFRACFGCALCLFYLCLCVPICFPPKAVHPESTGLPGATDQKGAGVPSG